MALKLPLRRRAATSDVAASWTASRWATATRSWT